MFRKHIEILVYEEKIIHLFEDCNPQLTMEDIAHDQSVNQFILDSHDDVTHWKKPSLPETVTAVFDKGEDKITFKIRTVFDEDVFDTEANSDNENLILQSNH